MALSINKIIDKIKNFRFKARPLVAKDDRETEIVFIQPRFDKIHKAKIEHVEACTTPSNVKQVLRGKVVEQINEGGRSGVLEVVFILMGVGVGFMLAVLSKGVWLAPIKGA